MDFSLHQLFPVQIPVRYSGVKNDVFLFCQDITKHKSKLKFDVSHPERNIGDIKESEDVCALGDIFINRQKHTEAHPVKRLTALQVKLFKTEMTLRYMRTRMEKARKDAKKQWRDLEQKEIELRKNFIMFNEFVHENHEKRTRAKKKMEDEKELMRRRQEHIDSYKEEMKIMKTVMKNMDNKTKNLKIFKDFLDRVVERSDFFKSVNDIIKTYQTMVMAKEFLDTKQRENLNILENSKANLVILDYIPMVGSASLQWRASLIARERSNLPDTGMKPFPEMKLIEEKNFVIMGLNNQIANLQARYENANIKALESEALVTQIKNNAVKQLGEIDTVKNSIWNVYVHMAASKKHPIKIKKDNVEEQMMYINRTLTELTKVNKLIKKKAFKGSK